MCESVRGLWVEGHVNVHVGKNMGRSVEERQDVPLSNTNAIEHFSRKLCLNDAVDFS